MSFNLPDGSKIYVGTTLGSAIAVSGITNANPAVATANAHGLSNLDEFLFLSGWEEANESVFRAAGVTANTLNVENLDATDTDWFPAGTGGGTIQKVTAWTEIQQITNIQMNGGDPKYATVELLSRKRDINLPAGFNASNIVLTMADDPTLSGQAALKTASRTIAKRPFKILMAGGGKGYFYGHVAFNDMPQLNKGQANSVTATISLLGNFTRYAT